MTMLQDEYMHIKLSDLPEDVAVEYIFAAKVPTDRYIYVKIRRGMHGLPRAGLLVQQLMEKQLNKEGYW